MTDAPLELLATVHRIQNAACSVLLAPTPISHVLPPVKVGKKEKKDKSEKDKNVDSDFAEKVDKYIIGLSPVTALNPFYASRMVMFNAAGDCENFRVSKTTLKRYPQVSLYNSLRDAHGYLFDHWVLDLLVAKPQIESIQGDLIPYLVKKQFDTTPFPIELPNSKWDRANLISSAKQCPDSISCFAVVAPADYFCQRVTTIAHFVRTNRKVAMKEIPMFQSIVNHFNRSTVGNDCLVGASFRCDKDSIFINCIFGSHCVIGTSCRISNCIIMDHVSVENGCIIEDSIICSNASILAKTTICSCNVSSGVTVSGIRKNENIQNENVLSE